MIPFMNVFYFHNTRGARLRTSDLDLLLDSQPSGLDLSSPRVLDSADFITRTTWVCWGGWGAGTWPRLCADNRTSRPHWLWAPNRGSSRSTRVSLGQRFQAPLDRTHGSSLHRSHPRVLGEPTPAAFTRTQCVQDDHPYLSILNCGKARGLNPRGVVEKPHVAQHHHGAEQEGRGVGHVLARDVRGGAVNLPEEREHGQRDHRQPSPGDAVPCHVSSFIRHGVRKQSLRKTKSQNHGGKVQKHGLTILSSF